MARKGTYLENYLDSVSQLPSELRRNFLLMRELDARSCELLERIDGSQKGFVVAAKRAARSHSSDEPAEAIIAQIRADFQKCMEYGDEKVALALQTYEMVDKHIRRLDNDLQKFEAELEQVSGVNPNTLVERASKDSKPSRFDPSGDGVRAGSSRRRDRRSSGYGAGAAADERMVVDLDMPVDPNEPTYCHCNRVSFGQMVGCDNEDCPIEWFHFDCVGLTQPPKGKWYCPDCSLRRKTA